MDEVKQEVLVACEKAETPHTDEGASQSTADVDVKKEGPEQASAATSESPPADYDPDQTYVMKVYSSQPTESYSGGACGTSEDLIKKDRKKKNRKMRDSESKTYESGQPSETSSATSDAGSTAESGESATSVPLYSSVLTQRDSGGSVDGTINAPNSNKQSSTNTIHYFCGNPSVEITEGIIHLYKEK